MVTNTTETKPKPNKPTKPMTEVGALATTGFIAGCGVFACCVVSPIVIIIYPFRLLYVRCKRCIRENSYIENYSSGNHTRKRNSVYATYL